MGRIHGGLRWITVSEPTRGWIAGTNWIALAPVPITPTRFPERSTSCRQSAEWNAGPAKSSRPSSSGIAGRESWPQAATITSASTVPPSVSIRQSAASPSQAAEWTSVFSRTESSTPSRRAVSST